MNAIFRISGIILGTGLLFSCREAKVILPPQVTTSPVTGVLYAFATSGGSVTDDGGSPTVPRGVCWGTNPAPTIADNKTSDGNGQGDFISLIEGLNFGTKYYLRAYASNNAGLVYGNELEFTTKMPGVQFNSALIYGTVSDIEGKSYRTVVIGSQVWMAENLKTSKLNDGTVLARVAVNSQWTNTVTAACCWYNNDQALYENIWGTYYNWFAVSTGKLCPVGWHVPSDSEWQTLVDFLGGEKTAGSELKEDAVNNWILSNNDATNSSGFTALPAGMRGSLNGAFSGQGYYGGWWSSTEVNSSPLGAAWSRWIHSDTTIVARSDIFKTDGFNVRCLKN